MKYVFLNVVGFVNTILDVFVKVAVELRGRECVCLFV